MNPAPTTIAFVPSRRRDDRSSASAFTRIPVTPSRSLPGTGRARLRAPVAITWSGDPDAIAWHLLAIIDGLNAHSLVRWDGQPDRRGLVQRAVAGLSPAPTRAQVDGNRCPQLAVPCEAIVKGDALVPEISAASILAKTARDAQLLELDRKYPQYGLAGHKGYPTPAHLAALRAHGACEIYRKSVGPVHDVIANPPLWTDEDCT